MSLAVEIVTIFNAKSRKRSGIRVACFVDPRSFWEHLAGFPVEAHSSRGEEDA